jgi:hypothetical protein
MVGGVTAAPNKTATRRSDRQANRKTDDWFKPGRGRQLPCLADTLLRIDGLMVNPVQSSDLDSERDWMGYVWTHPRIVEILDFVDAEEPEWAADFKWKRSSLLFIAVVSLALGLNLKQAHNRVRTDDELRRLGGFEPRPSRHERRRLLGQPLSVSDPHFPARQCTDDLINRWLGGKKPSKASPLRRASFVQEEVISERGVEFLALVEKAMQEVAFTAILTYGLSTSRLVMDGSIVLSGHVRANICRTDYGAKSFKKDDDDKDFVFGRMLGTVQLVGAPFVIYSRVFRPDNGEPGMAKDMLLPGAEEASGRLIEFAADHGVEGHKGFAGAAMCADGAFDNHPCIEETFRHGFLPAYNVGSDLKEVLGSRELVVKATGMLVTVDLRDDGALLCRCDASMALEERPEMKRRVEKPGRSAYMHCEDCGTTYFMTPRKQDDSDTIGDKGDIDLRYDVTLPRWDRRVVAMSFKARNEIEAMHSEMDAMGLLPDGRGGKSWRSLTGDFRHAFWYGLGHLLWNIRVAYNLSKTTERQEYTWAEGFAAFTRNRHQIEHQEELAARRAERAKRAALRRKKGPRYTRKGKHIPVVPQQVTRSRTRDLDSTLAARTSEQRARARSG